jgi:hypothetical protein
MKYEKKTESIIVVLTLFFSIMLPLSGCTCNRGKSSTPTNTIASSQSSTTSQTVTAVSQSPATSQLSGYVLVTSADGNVSISVPSGWNTNATQLYPGSVIGVADDTNNEYLIITEKPKTSLKASDTIDDYLNIVKIAFGAAVTNPVWGQPSNVTIGGCKGLSVRLTGKRISNNTDTVYFVNALESKNYFYNVCGYTLTSSEGANKAAIEKIINSFKEKD